MKKVKWRDLFSLDCRSLALFRILLGLYILHDLFERSADLAAHYTDDGVLPRSHLPPWGRLGIPLHRLAGSPALQSALFVAAAVVALSLVVGYRTRLATTLAWVLHVSLLDRNSLVLAGGDYLVRLMLFWCLFVPLGQCWSVDAWRRARRGSPAPRGGWVFSAGVAAFVVQILSVYVFTGLLKCESPVWHQGRAIYDGLLCEHTATPLGTRLLQYPRLLAALTYSSLAFETLGLLLFFSPWAAGPLRTLGVFGILFFQLGIRCCLILGNFQSGAMLMVVPLLPAWFWDTLLPWFGLRTGTDPPAAAPAPLDQGLLARAVAGAVACMAAFVFLCNVGSLFFAGDMPGRPERLTYFLGIDQRWSMYVHPFPRASGWTILHATLEDGRSVDLLSGKDRDLWERPEVLRAIYKNWRWQRYYTDHIWRESGVAHRANLGAFLRRQWDVAHPPGQHIRSLEIIWMAELLKPSGERTGLEKRILWQGDFVPQGVDQQ
jgi:hypothetical protein